MPNPQGSFIWYELMTPDPDASKTFYDAVVGWTIDDHSTGPEGTDYRMIKRADGGNAGGVLKLDDQMQAHGARPAWLGYVYMDDVDAAVAKAGELGGKALIPPFDAPGVGRISMIADPQGNPLYIMKPTPPGGDTNATSDVFALNVDQRVGWNELATVDAETDRDFYVRMFGWDTDQFMDMGQYGKYRFIFQDGVRIGAISGTMPDAPQAWRFYFRVPSIAAAVQAIDSAGGKVTMGPHEVPEGDHIVIGTDPQGAMFALVGKA